MTSMTRRALARSATISAGAAIAVPLKTPLARSCTATLQHTRLGAVAYGRICPVHIWPVLRCPPRRRLSLRRSVTPFEAPPFVSVTIVLRAIGLLTGGGPSQLLPEAAVFVHQPAAAARARGRPSSADLTCLFRVRVPSMASAEYSDTADSSLLVTNDPNTTNRAR